jgi:predicted nucleotidyltransferase
VKQDIRKQLMNYFISKPVLRAYLFGSFARNEQVKNSDIDILVELDYEGGADYFIFYKMQQDLNRLLNKKVDLVSANGLSQYVQPLIDKEKELVYERENSGRG